MYRFVVCLLVTLTAIPASASTRVSLRRGVLRVNGNDAVNVIDVTASSGAVIVESARQGLIDSFPFEDVERIVIRTRGKADSVYVSVTHFPDVEIVTGAGADTVEVRGCVEDLRINTGAAGDYVEITRAYIHGDTRIDTAMGDDVIVLGETGGVWGGNSGHLGGAGTGGGFGNNGWNAANFHHELDIFMGIGNDQLLANRVNFGSEEERRVATSLGMAVDLLIDLHIRITGYTGRDCYELGTINLPLEDYMRSCEVDCLEIPE